MKFTRIIISTLGILIFLFIGISTVLAQKVDTTSSVKGPVLPSVSGYFVTYWQYDMNSSAEDENNFKVNMARIGFKGDLNDRSSYKVLIDFTRSGGDILLDAVVSFIPVTGAKMNIGQFKTNYSTLNLRSATAQRFVSKPLMSSKTSPPTRDIGVSMEYKQSQYSASLGLFNGESQNSTDQNTAKNLSFRTTFNPSKILNLAGNVYYGKTTGTTAEDLLMYNGSFGFIHHRLSIEGEYGYYDTDNLSRTGFFTDMLYEFDLTGIVKSITPGVRYDWYDQNLDSDNDAQSRITTSTKFTFRELTNMHLRIDYELNSLESGADADNRLFVEAQLKF